MDAVATPVKPRAKPVHRITVKQQLYAELRAQGLSRAESAKQAGYKDKTVAYKAEKHPLVQEHLQSIQRLSQVKSSYTVDKAMAEAKDTMEFAYQTKNANAYCKAVELRAKLSGLLIDRVEVFSADLKGALLAASQRVIEASPGTYALLQETQAQLQVEPLREEH